VLAGKWVVELSELESVSRADVAKVKAYLTAQNDTYRASYGSRADVRDYPRHCVFIGTTNDDDYLKDATGNRRFWPVKLGGEVDLEGLRAAGEQLWAEAFARYSRGEAWHIEDRAILAGLEAAQEERFAADPWETALRLKLEDQDPVEIPYAEKGVSTDESLTLLGIDVAKRTKTDAMRVAAVLKRLGWERKQTRGKQNWKQREWRYFPSAGKVVDVTSPGGWEKRGGDVGGDAGKEAVVTTVTNVTNIIKGVRGKSVTPGGPGTANVTGDIGDAAPVIPLPGRRKRSEVAAR
jgi:putative DNA primase/helicase